MSNEQVAQIAEDPRPTEELGGNNGANGPVGYDPTTSVEHDDSPEALAELLDAEAQVDQTIEAVGVPALSWGDDADQPDFAHTHTKSIEGLEIKSHFEFNWNVFELLLSANHFKPRGKNGLVVFGLRGGKLIGSDIQDDVDAVKIEDTRPDHTNFQCTLGIINTNTKSISAYKGSTVPNRAWMRNYYKLMNGIQPHKKTRSNLLPTGCYIYRVNAHGGGRINPALRMTNPDNLSADATCTVLRTHADLIYSHDDFWDVSTPFDNIHCAYSDHEFSSAGCQTIKGANGSGAWGEFQKVIGSLGWDARIDYVLLTGREASIASAILAAGRHDDASLIQAALGRLRVGSEGETVTALQKKLGFKGSAYFGPQTKKRLIEAEVVNGLNSDGVYSLEDDAATGWGVFSAPSPPTEIMVTGTAVDNSGVTTATDATISLTKEKFDRFAPRARSDYRDSILEHGHTILGDYLIDATPQRLANFLAQVSHESGGFTHRVESLNYTDAARIRDTWPSRFRTVESAKPFVRNEIDLANKVYGDRMGNIREGDGFRFRGRGLIQLTGRENYEKYGERLQVDLIRNPDLAAQSEIALRIAAQFWENQKLPGERPMNALADDDKLRAITYRINGGFTNFEHRKQELSRAKRIWGNQGSSTGALRIVERGDFSDDVRHLQLSLVTIGRLQGQADGKFGLSTYKALFRFKNEMGLDGEGFADQRTFDALIEAEKIEAFPIEDAEPLPTIGDDPEPVRIGVARAEEDVPV